MSCKMNGACAAKTNVCEKCRSASRRKLPFGVGAICDPHGSGDGRVVPCKVRKAGRAQGLAGGQGRVARLREASSDFPRECRIGSVAGRKDGGKPERGFTQDGRRAQGFRIPSEIARNCEFSVRINRVFQKPHPRIGLSDRRPEKPAMLGDRKCQHVGPPSCLRRAKIACIGWDQIDMREDQERLGGSGTADGALEMSQRAGDDCGPLRLGDEVGMQSQQFQLDDDRVLVPIGAQLRLMAVFDLRDQTLHRAVVQGRARGVRYCAVVFVDETGSRGHDIVDDLRADIVVSILCVCRRRNQQDRRDSNNDQIHCWLQCGIGCPVPFSQSSREGAPGSAKVSLDPCRLPAGLHNLAPIRYFASRNGPRHMRPGRSCTLAGQARVARMAVSMAVRIKAKRVIVFVSRNVTLSARRSRPDVKLSATIFV